MTVRARATVVAVVAAAVAVACWPPAAFALCPNCLGQRDTLSPTMQLVGLFLLVPFAVAVALLRIIRRATRAGDDPPR